MYPIGPIWSLNVEEHCYVLLSLLTVPALRYGEWFARWSLALLALLCVAVFVYYKYYPPQAKTLFFMRSEVAALPLLLSCSIYLFMRRNSWKPHSWVPVAGALVTLVTPFLTDSVFLRYLLISGAAAISVNTLHAAPRWLLHSLEQPLLRWLGLCSFSLYLWHQLFFFFYRGEHPLGYTMLAYGGSIALAAASYHGFEKPMRRWLTGASTPRDTSPA
jgi:peptidoglycan/LPS O-acetylase OafA/YrhL